MSMLDWAKREVELACKRENPNREEGEWDYGCACYKSALKAYESLTQDGHSGMSWSLTAGILRRLMANKPLTPIEDTDENWNEVDTGEYQCKRMSSLFKSINTDGSIKYKDVDRIVCVAINNPYDRWYSGLVSNIIDKMIPITMPYYPTVEPIEVMCEELLTDPKNGDFDTLGILSAKMPDGDIVDIQFFFKESPDSWKEISHEEWNKRKEISLI